MIFRSSSTTVERFIWKPNHTVALVITHDPLCCFLGWCISLHIDVDLPDPERKAYQLGIVAWHWCEAMASFLLE